MNAPLILSLSPRPAGNSDTAAACFAAALPAPPSVRYLREYRIKPCVGCAACASTGQCILAAGDQTEDLFVTLEQAPALILTAPVYFYHLPAQAKAWIDRAQSRYLLRQAQPRARASLRPAAAILIAGRPRGEELFIGILRTLAYFLDIFDYELAATICLRGLDERCALSADATSLAAITTLAQSRTWHPETC